KYLRALLNWRAGAIYGVVPEPVRTFVADTLARSAPARIGRLIARSFLAVPRTPEAMFFDNFAAIGLRRQQSLLAPGRAPEATAERAYGASRAYFDAPG